ncbi:uncharacterized protein JN550_006160 [Neoarthrinium moseri]|uniref:uncharacterized protein n=1 Tax=Neoarthrinium moseri TaxID=1658444 RepID=UPI001FDDBDC6|nr:uncharacterized protein JN550_006160 [Neoarthrinium moseri]KAI1868585.1 hypothetical protein JN550_006160 [Neoarthrinium moseri]
MAEPGLMPTDLASQYRAIYRAQFKADVAAGTKQPLFFHLLLLGIHIIPALYLAIPHKRRPWLYHARWLVLAATTSFHVWMIRTTSSTNFAFAYGTGLVASWGIIWNFTLLVWTRPQWDAKRVERFKNTRSRGESSASSANGEVGRRPGATNGAIGNGPATQANGHTTPAATTALPETNGNASRAGPEQRLRDRKRAANGHMSNGSAVEGEDGERRMQEPHTAILERANCNGHSEVPGDVNETSASQQFVYEWQEFPESAPFLTRLDWAVDIATTMRMTGWNWAIPVLPPYRPPPWFSEDSVNQLPLEFVRNDSRQGYTRVRTRGELFLGRFVLSMLPAYIILDACATFMLQDPYFVLGPNSLPLPPHLAAMNPLWLSFRRTLYSFVGIIAALQMAWNFGALCLAFLAPPVLGFRADPWHLPTMSGSFLEVLDRGLAGFWGSWWHQTFRFGFAAPTKWLIRQGYLTKGSTAAGIVGALIAFVQSGFLHSMGSYTTVPESRPWDPPIFFFLSGVGTQLQAVLARLFKARIEQMPRWVKRISNLAFVFIWLHITCKFLLDDFGRSGLWLWEPVPFSFVRWLGYGIPGDFWWRWDRDSFPRWYTGKHWWTSGIGI